MNKHNVYRMLMTSGYMASHRDVIKVNLDEGEKQVIEVDGETRIVIRKGYGGNLTIKTQHKEWVDDDSASEYELQA